MSPILPYSHSHSPGLKSRPYTPPQKPSISALPFGVQPRYTHEPSSSTDTVRPRYAVKHDRTVSHQWQDLTTAIPSHLPHIPQHCRAAFYIRRPTSAGYSLPRTAGYRCHASSRVVAVQRCFCMRCILVRQGGTNSNIAYGSDYLAATSTLSVSSY